VLFPHIEGYRLLERLGRGGMGEVFAAEDVLSGDRVAIKVLRGATEQVLTALRAEVETLISLRHPGVVRLLDSGTVDGRPWYAMELVEGVTLRHRMRHLRATVAATTRDGQGDPHADDWWTQTAYGVGVTEPYAAPVVVGHGGQLERPERAGPTVEEAGIRAPSATVLDDPPLRTLVATLAQTARTLAHLHDQGVLHCDLKPANIVLREEAAAGGRPSVATPVLIDFGLARGVSDPGHEQLDLRATNVGSIHYMAPEQVVGDPLDERTDLYALGCILFEVCAGRLPFEGLKRDVLDQRLHRPAPRLADVAAGIPAELDALVARLLATAPEQRPLAASDVADVLQRLLRGESIEDDSGGAPTLRRPPFVGRGDDLRRVMATVSRARGDRGGVVVVGGQSGIGKTRLGVAVARQARTLGFAVAGGQCQPLSLIDGGLHAGMLHPLLPLLGAMLDRSRSEPGSHLAAAVAEHAGTMGMFDPRWRQVAAVPDRQATSASEVFIALRGLLEAYTRTKPLLVVLDDLQWADEMTMEALEFLVNSRFEWQRLALVGLYRTEEEDNRIAELRAHPAVKTHILEPLDSRAIAQVIAGMLAVDLAPHDLLSHVSRHAEGNPFFVAEYLRTAFGEGMLRRPDPRRWNVTGDLRRVRASAETSDLPLPPTIVQLVQRRLQGLDDGAMALLRAAAVVGRVSQLPLLRRAVGLPRGRFDAILELLGQRQVLEVDGGNARFVHDKIREAAYQGTPDDDRTALHRTVATVLASATFAERPGRDRELAHHFLQAGESARAASYLGRAAQTAFDAGAFSDALNLLQRQLALLSDAGDHDRQAIVHLHRLRAGATLALGRVADCHDAVAEVMRVAGHALPASPAAWLRAGVDHAVALGAQWLTGERITWGREGLYPVAHDVALALGYLSEVHYNRNDARAMAATIVIAMNLLIRSGRQDELARPWGRLAYLLGQLQLAGAAQRCFARAQEIADRGGHVVDGAFCATIHANYLVGLGRFDEAKTHCRAALATLKEHSDPHGEAVARTVLGIAQHLAGDHVGALASYERVFTDSEERAAVQHRGWGIIGRASAHISAGQLDRAAELLDAERDFFDERIDLGSRVVFHGHRADRAVRAGDLDDAQREAELVQALTDQELIAQVTMIYALSPMVRVAGALFERDGRDRAPAMGLLNRAIERLDQYAKRFPIGRPVLLRARALLARIGGRDGAARRLDDRAAALSDKLGLPHGVAVYGRQLAHSTAAIPAPTESSVD